MNLRSVPSSKKCREIVRNVTVRLGLLEKLEERVPCGKRAAFLEKLLSRELERPARNQRVAK
jgi:hypothetical protein